VPDVHVLRVFCAPDGSGGNLLGVVRHGAAVPDVPGRQRLAAALGFSETIFIDDPLRGTVDIFTPSSRLAFAGHPLVGAGWLLRREGRSPAVLRPGAGEVGSRADGELSWIAARPEWSAGKQTRRLGSAAEVDALAIPPAGTGWLYAWAWEDEAAGRVRARGFPGRGDGISEDEATGSAALLLTGELGRCLEVRQGHGSQILTRPLPDGRIEVGGRVRLAEVRAL
jgi:predicted PhzF superfamily epimerase YddE/YHI9